MATLLEELNTQIVNGDDKQYLAIKEEKLVIVDNNNRENENLISLYKYIDDGLLKTPIIPETYFKSLVESFNDNEGKIKNKLKEFISRYIHKYIEHTYNQNNSRKNLEFFYKKFYENDENANKYIKKYAKQDAKQDAKQVDLALALALQNASP